jgi:hypothetical protein
MAQEFASILTSGTNMNKSIALFAVAIALTTAGCVELNPETGIMRAAPGDPVGSANTGTASVTVNGQSAPEMRGMISQ